MRPLKTPVARRDKVLAAEGAVLFLEKVSPALEHVDSSSGMIGTAVNNAIDSLVEIIATAPADPKTRGKWLERARAAASRSSSVVAPSRSGLDKLQRLQGLILFHGPPVQRES